MPGKKTPDNPWSVNLTQRRLALKRIYRTRTLFKKRAPSALVRPKILHNISDTYNSQITSFILWNEFGIRSKEMTERISTVLAAGKTPYYGAERDILTEGISQQRRQLGLEGKRAQQREAIKAILGDPEKGEIFWKDFQEIRESRRRKRKHKK